MHINKVFAKDNDMGGITLNKYVIKQVLCVKVILHICNMSFL